MKNLSQNITQTQTPGFYYAQVYALTPKETIGETRASSSQNDSPLGFLFSPFLIYASIILFFSLFIGAIVIQIINKSLNLKRTLTTLVVVFMIASMPISLKTALEVTNLQSKASSDETPQQIEIKQESDISMTVSWKTVVEKVGAVRMSPVPLQENSAQVIIADGGKKTLMHVVVMTNLEAGKEYEFEILSGSKWYNNDGQPLQFTLHTL